MKLYIATLDARLAAAAPAGDARLAPGTPRGKAANALEHHGAGHEGMEHDSAKEGAH